VTGGSMGIGKEFVKILGDCGFNILIVSNDEGSNKRVVEDLEKEREKKLK
jgi:NAD(P)-dependent dehydrogenase (short-subunit alcohol dehydrogenase family)